METPATIRRAVRSYLAQRPAISQKAETIHRSLSREMEVTVEQVAGACQFLVGLQQAKAITDPMGADKYFQITSEGSLADERGE